MSFYTRIPGVCHPLSHFPPHKHSSLHLEIIIIAQHENSFEWKHYTLQTLLLSLNKITFLFDLLCCMFWLISCFENINNLLITQLMIVRWRAINPQDKTIIVKKCRICERSLSMSCLATSSACYQVEKFIIISPPSVSQYRTPETRSQLYYLIYSPI